MSVGTAGGVLRPRVCAVAWIWEKSATRTVASVNSRVFTTNCLSLMDMRELVDASTFQRVVLTALDRITRLRNLRDKTLAKLGKTKLFIILRNLERAPIHIEFDFGKLHRHARAVG